MPPKPSNVSILKDGPLTFLYPRSSRRFLSTSQPRKQQADGLQSLITSMSLNTQQRRQPPPTQTRTAALPAEAKTFSFLKDLGNAQSRDRGPIDRARKFFQDADQLSQAVQTQFEQNNETRALLEKSMVEPINPEIYQYQNELSPGASFSPKDLSYEEFARGKQMRGKKATQKDLFKRLHEDPMKHYKNFNLLKDFMTTAGRIKHRNFTGLSNVNQRKVSKAIRRAVGIGLMPSVYKHPEILKFEQLADNRRWQLAQKYNSM